MFVIKETCYIYVNRYASCNNHEYQLEISSRGKTSVKKNHKQAQKQNDDDFKRPNTAENSMIYFNYYFQFEKNKTNTIYS